MNYALLTGEFEVTLDERNRLLIPAEVRQAIEPERDGKAFYATRGPNGRLWLYLRKHYESLVAKDEPVLLPTLAAQEFDQVHFPKTRLVPWDKLGRLLLPAALFESNETEKAKMLVGVRNHLELWERAEWSFHSKELERRRSEIALRAQLERDGTRPRA